MVQGANITKKLTFYSLRAKFCIFFIKNAAYSLLHGVKYCIKILFFISLQSLVCEYETESLFEQSNELWSHFRLGNARFAHL